MASLMNIAATKAAITTKSATFQMVLQSKQRRLPALIRSKATVTTSNANAPTNTVTGAATGTGATPAQAHAQAQTQGPGQGQSTIGSTMSGGANLTTQRGKATMSMPASNAGLTMTSTAASSASSSSSSSAKPSIASLCAAAAAGIATVGLAATAVEQLTASDCPRYYHAAASPQDNNDIHNNRQRQRFDASTFGGRFAQMLLACDPRLLLNTPSQVQRAQALLDDWQLLRDDRSRDRELWEAKRVVEASVHPDTGSVIPAPFRMSGYVPFNGPICVAMVASTSTAPILFWSFINQSQNALVNYYNRNASAPMSNETLLKSYGAAVTAALSVAFGLATVIQKRYPKEQASRLLKWVAFPSAVVASSLNCYIVRSPEIDAGIPLLDPVTHEPIQVYNNATGTTEPALSQEAARRGVNSTTVSRAILQAPVYFLPPLLAGSLPLLAPYLRRRPQFVVPVTTYLLLVSFGIGLPASVACFPQMASIAASDVEPRYQHLSKQSVQPDGTVVHRPSDSYVYNKGM